MRNSLRAAACFFLLLLFSARAFAAPFSDVPTDHWAYKAIEELQERGLWKDLIKSFLEINQLLVMKWQ